MSSLKMKKQKYKFKEFLENLNKSHKIETIVARFSGGGDSGDIDYVEYFIDLDKEQQIDMSDVFTNDEDTKIRQFLYHYLDSTGYDWYNNDGGFGDISINVLTGEIECSMNINVMTSEEYNLTDSGDVVSDYKMEF